MGVMSDGKSDGLVLMYHKEGKIYPVALSQDNLDMLNMLIPGCLEKINLINKPLDVEVTNLCK